MPHKAHVKLDIRYLRHGGAYWLCIHVRPSGTAAWTPVFGQRNATYRVLNLRQAGTTARYVRVTVVDHTQEGRPAAKITIPLSVVTWGLKVAQTFSPDMTSTNLA